MEIAVEMSFEGGPTSMNKVSSFVLWWKKHNFLKEESLSFKVKIFEVQSPSPLDKELKSYQREKKKKKKMVVVQKVGMCLKLLKMAVKFIIAMASSVGSVFMAVPMTYSPLQLLPDPTVPLVFSYFVR